MPQVPQQWEGQAMYPHPTVGTVVSAPAPFFGVFWGFSPALLLLILVLWASGRFYEPPPNSSSGFLSRQDQQESISGHSDNKILWIQKSPSRLRNQPRPAEHPDFIQKFPDDVSTFPFTMYITWQAQGQKRKQGRESLKITTLEFTDTEGQTQKVGLSKNVLGPTLSEGERGTRIRT